MNLFKTHVESKLFLNLAKKIHSYVWISQIVKYFGYCTLEVRKIRRTVHKQVPWHRLHTRVKRAHQVDFWHTIVVWYHVLLYSKSCCTFFGYIYMNVAQLERLAMIFLGSRIQFRCWHMLQKGSNKGSMLNMIVGLNWVEECRKVTSVPLMLMQSWRNQLVTEWFYHRINLILCRIKGPSFYTESKKAKIVSK